MKNHVKCLFLIPALMAGLGLILTNKVTAQTFTTLHTFRAAVGIYGTNSDGDYSQAGLILSGNTLYGTAGYGGTNGFGTVFALNTDGSSFITLHNFSKEATNQVGINTNRDGTGPNAGLILSGNTLYGTASAGGTNGSGTVFSLTVMLPVVPQLAIALSGANVILTWPTNAAGFTLESATNLVPPAIWITNASPPVVVGTNNAVTNGISGTREFYRLSQ